MIGKVTNYIDKSSYFQDMAIIDERLKRLEHIMDVLTKKEVEALSDKETDKSKRNNNE
jgi:hypothetical protein